MKENQDEKRRLTECCSEQEVELRSMKEKIQKNEELQIEIQNCTENLENQKQVLFFSFLMNSVIP